MPIERAPRDPLPRHYVPQGGMPYRVRDGDDWKSVALKNGLNAQALIYFNFKTNNADEVNWYLRRNTGCDKSTSDGANWMFSSSAQAGIIYLPTSGGSGGSFNSFTYSIASLSWIDPITGLPEVDLGDPGQIIKRGAIFARHGYRFANFLEASISVMDTARGPMLSIVGDYGFSRESGMYRSLSFAGIPSEPFSVKRTIEVFDDRVKFKQIAGARTQSPEIMAESLLLPFGRPIAEDVFPFAPIWTELELTIYFTGNYEGKLLRHSLFPSISFYYGSKIMKVADGGWVIPVRDEIGASYYRVSAYDGVPNASDWEHHGWGILRDANPRGPVSGNPWGVPRGRDRSWLPQKPWEPIEDPIDNAGDYVEDSFDETSASTE